MSRMRWAVALGLVTGTIGLVFAMIPAVSALEDSIGLRWMFLVRGTVPPPSHVTIVSIDEPATVRMGLPPLVRDWPRSTHARLVDRLVERGASAIAFDVEFFRRGSAEDDQQFAQSVARARRVILVQRFKESQVDGREIWNRQNPIPPLATAALALAPPPVPDASAVSWFWSFLLTPDLGEVPTLPAVVLQVHMLPALASFLDGLKAAGIDGLDGLPRTAADIRSAADLLGLMQAIRTQAAANPSAVSTLIARVGNEAGDTPAAERRDALIALAAMYSGPGKAYLNFYGPPGTICTVPYDRLFALDSNEPSPCPVRDSIVFIGLARSRVLQADQDDTYHTLYESPDGVDFSGVELHATALSNLLTRSALRTPSPVAYFATVLSVGGCFAAGAYWVRTRRRRVPGAFPARWQAAAALTACAALYCGIAYGLFRYDNLTIPLVIPLTIQFPTALILGLLVPPTLYQEQVRAVCLATDAEGSTALGQLLPNEEYARLLHNYNQELSRPVRIHGGTALDPEGDGFVSLWCSAAGVGAGSDVGTDCRLQACTTALEIADAAHRFSLGERDGTRLPARMGLTMGTITIHSDADRGVFKVFGDAVNVAARLRDLNRHLGSRVLASEEVVAGLDSSLVVRPVVANVELKGVTRPPVIFEVVAVVAVGDERRTSASGS